MLLSRLAPLAALTALAAACARADAPPAWAYAVASPGTPEHHDDGRVHHVPGSTLGLTEKQFEAHRQPIPDWHPEEHPPMPAIASVGREPQVWACAYCHLPNGAGRPENASLAGLTPAYFRQQVADFKSGKRAGSEPRRGPEAYMIAIAKAVTEEEVNQAAAYFGSLKPAGFVKVVESATVPVSYVAGAMYARLPGGGEEPIGNRIIEMPDDLAQAENRDSRTPYTAFVPPGSLAAGAALATTGNGGRTMQCSLCHGPDLRGLGDFPRLAGRSPSYLMRQLYDFKSGARTSDSGLMKVVVAQLSEKDMLALSAYLASRTP
jgi:cytochrome c553